VIAQYKRDEYGVGNEEELHWALIVITSRDNLQGHCKGISQKNNKMLGWRADWVR